MKYKKSLVSIITVFVLSICIIMPCLSKAADVTPLSQAKDLVLNKYVNDITDYVLEAKSIGDLLDRVNDKNNYYYTSDEYAAYQKSLLNDITGIGVALEKCAKGAKVLYAPKNTPAYTAGIRENDVILSINSNSIEKTSISDVYNKFKGEDGTTIFLTILRKGKNQDFTVTRKTMDYATVYGEEIKNTGYIKITDFTNTTADEFNNIYNNLKVNKPDGYIIDLRDNSGENIYTALDICSRFIGNNAGTVVETNGHVKQKITCNATAEIINKPLVVIMNSGTKKAAEILTAALKDYKKAIIIGAKSGGNTTQEEYFKLMDGSYLKLTTKRYLSPNSNQINNYGIQTNFDINEENDINTAVLLLSNAALTEKNYALIDVKDIIACISTGEASKAENWNVFKDIVNQACSKYSLKLYNGSYGKFIYPDDLKKMWSLYYPGFKELSPLKGVEPTKEFTITFSQGIDFSTINNQSIELINTDNGTRTELIFTKVNDKVISATVLGRLNDNGTYVLVIHDGLIKDLKSRVLRQGAICLIQVK